MAASFFLAAAAFAQLTVIEAAEDYFAKGKYDLSLEKYQDVLKNPFGSAADVAVSQCRIGVIYSIQNKLAEARNMLEDATKGQSLPAKHASICHYALLQVYTLGSHDIEARDLVRRMGTLQLAPVYQARAYALAAELGARLHDPRFEVVHLQKLLSVMETNKLIEVELKALQSKKITVQDIRNRLGVAQKSLPTENKAQNSHSPNAEILKKAQEIKTPTPAPAHQPVFQQPIPTVTTAQPPSLSNISISSNSPALRLLSLLSEGDLVAVKALVEKEGPQSLQSSLSALGIGVPVERIFSRITRLLADDPRVVRVGVILPKGAFFTRFNSRILRAVSSFSASSAVRGVTFQFYVKGISPDSGGADVAASELIFTHHVHAILGPISNSQAVGALGVSQIFKVPVFSLGPVVGSPELVADVHTRMGILARSQALALVNHAQKDLKIKNSAVLAPNDSYGHEMATAFVEVSKQLSFPVQNVRYYSANSDVFKEDVSGIIGPQDTAARKEEYEDFVKAAKEKAEQEKRRFDPKKLVFPPLLAYDALFVPEALGKSRVIASTFAYFGVENARMLGDRQWLEGAGRSSIADPFMNGARVPSPVEGDFFTFLRSDLGVTDANLDLERQAFDALILLRTAQFRSGGSIGGRLVKALRLADFNARGTMVYNSVGADGEPLARFSLMSYQNGKVVNALSPWKNILKLPDAESESSLKN